MLCVSDWWFSCLADFNLIFGNISAAQHCPEKMQKCHVWAGVARNQAQQRPAEESEAAQTTTTGELELLNVTV